VIVAATDHPILPVQLGLFAGFLLLGLVVTVLGIGAAQRRHHQFRNDYQRGVFLTTEMWTDEMEDWLLKMDRRYGSLPPHLTQANVWLFPIGGQPIVDATSNRYHRRLEWLHARLD